MAQAYQVPPPEAFDFERPSDWPKWRRRFERFKNASGLVEQPDEKKIDTLIYVMGTKADDIFSTFKFRATPEVVAVAAHGNQPEIEAVQAWNEKDDYQAVLEKFQDHFVVRHNVIYERAVFNRRIQAEHESVENFLTDLNTLSEHCDYGDLREELIRDRIVVGIKDRRLSEKMQLDRNLTLIRATEMARQARRIKVEARELFGSETVSKVEKHRDKKGHRDRERGSTSSISWTRSQKGDARGKKVVRECQYCGFDWPHKDRPCAAERSECHYCKKAGHFKRKCPDRKRQTFAVAESDSGGCESDSTNGSL